MSLALNHQFEEILEPLGQHSVNFFMAAALYHAHKLSFTAAASLAGLEFEAFAVLLKERYGSGFWITDEVGHEDIQLATELSQR
ncbi:hypothetical protein D5085_07685 [Ectothiorhodospiraceae bacterium BW-2]|nr:hypothetical protein D5085_07685 [Ectothiorhodospiraceae bacterium BW-2]